jgi:hypothetical protein
MTKAFSIEQYDAAIQEIKDLLINAIENRVHVDEIWEVLDSWLDTSEEEENE